MSADVILSCRLANHDIVTTAGEIALSAPLHKGGTSKILELLAKEVRCCSLAALFFTIYFDHAYLMFVSHPPH